MMEIMIKVKSSMNQGEILKFFEHLALKEWCEEFKIIFEEKKKNEKKEV